MPTKTSTGWSESDVQSLGLILRNSTGGLANSDVTLLIERPSGVVSRWTWTSTAVGGSTASPSTGIRHASLGSYRFDFKSTACGDFKYQWRSSGAVDQSTSGRWSVHPALVSS